MYDIFILLNVLYLYLVRCRSQLYFYTTGESAPLYWQCFGRSSLLTMHARPLLVNGSNGCRCPQRISVFIVVFYY